MSIQTYGLQCECGFSRNTKPALAGKKVFCPKCEAKVMVRQIPVPGDLWGELDAMGPQPPKPHIPNTMPIKAEPPQRPKPPRLYRLVKIVRAVLYYVSGMTLAAWLLFAVVVLLGSVQVAARIGSEGGFMGLVMIAGSFIPVSFSIALNLAVAEGLRLLVDIQENTRG